MARVRPHRSRAPLGVEPLEDRCTPAATGIPWPDGMHLTLSFVPDGTAGAAGPSRLHEALDAVAPRAVWQREVLRAFQAWAAPANLNVGLTADGGQPVGTPGTVQGDPRFGDVRISAAPLPPGTLATNTPFRWSGTTWAGDVVLNTGYPFTADPSAGEYDLFTVMLNEAGNVFGVSDDPADLASAVYPWYAGPRTGPTAADGAAVRSLYGPRAPDRYDATAPNDTRDRATPLPLDPAAQRADGDLTAAGDEDHYAFRVPGPIAEGPADVGGSATVSLAAAGLSGLSGVLEVYDDGGRLVGRADAAGAPGRDLAVPVPNPMPGRTYVARVVGAADPTFAVGSYRLAVAYQHYTRTPSDPAPAGPFAYTFRGTVALPFEVDTYQVTAPATAGRTLRVIVSAAADGGLVPKVEVFDHPRARTPLPARVVGNENGTYAVELPGAAPGATYTLKVGALYPAGRRATGGYVVGAAFTAPLPDPARTFAAGTLTAKGNQAEQGLTVTQNKLYQFTLTAGGAALAEVQLDVVDAAGRVVATARAYAGLPAVTTHVYLPAGSYRVRYTAAAPAGKLVPTPYTLTARVASDPIGPAYTDEPGGGSPPPPPPADPVTATKVKAYPKTWDAPYYF